MIWRRKSDKAQDLANEKKAVRKCEAPWRTDPCSNTTLAKTRRPVTQLLLLLHLLCNAGARARVSYTLCLPPLTHSHLACAPQRLELQAVKALAASQKAESVAKKVEEKREKKRSHKKHARERVEHRKAGLLANYMLMHARVLTQLCSGGYHGLVS